MFVQIFSVTTTAGERYGLKNSSGDVLTNATAKWKTAQGAKNYAHKMGCTLKREVQSFSRFVPDAHAQ